MPDLGERGNVMGPQPIGKIVEPPAAMMAAAKRLLTALSKEIARTPKRSRIESRAKRSLESPMSSRAGRYDNFELIGRARVAKHYFLKARITGRDATPVTLQFRLGEEDGKWQVREIWDLTGRRSGWSK